MPIDSIDKNVTCVSNSADGGVLSGNVPLKANRKRNFPQMPETITKSTTLNIDICFRVLVALIVILLLLNYRVMLNQSERHPGKSH